MLVYFYCRKIKEEILKIIEIFGKDKWFVIDHHVNGPMEIKNYPENCIIDKNNEKIVKII